MEEYFKKMEIIVIPAIIEEDQEATIARFICGINRVISNLVKLQHYVDLENVVLMAIIVEMQLKGSGQSFTKPNGCSSSWNTHWSSPLEQEENISSKAHEDKSMAKTQSNKNTFSTKLKKIVILSVLYF